MDAFDAHLARAEKLYGYEALVEYERALALCQWDFLSGEIYDWAEGYSREYQKRRRSAAHRAAKLAIDCRDLEMASKFFEGILHRDPLDEEAVRGIMRCYASRGDSIGVRQAYKSLVASLRREMDEDSAEPLPETTKSFEELTGRQSFAR